MTTNPTADAKVPHRRTSGHKTLAVVVDDDVDAAAKWRAYGGRVSAKNIRYVFDVTAGAQLLFVYVC